MKNLLLLVGLSMFIVFCTPDEVEVPTPTTIYDTIVINSTDTLIINLSDTVLINTTDTVIISSIDTLIINTVDTITINTTDTITLVDTITVNDTIFVDPLDTTETNLFNPSAWLWGSWIDDALENRVTFSEDNIIIQKLSGGQVIQEDNLNNLYYGNFSITEVYDWGEDVVAAPWFLDTGYTVSVKNVQDVYAFIGDFTSNSSPNNPASGNAIIWRNTYWDWLGAAVPNEESFEIILTKEL